MFELWYNCNVNRLINKLKQEVTKVSSNPNFIHHKWFVEFHLKIVEQLTNELCEIYLDADKNLSLILVWIHDYGKILGEREDLEKVIDLTRTLLVNLKFNKKDIDKCTKYLRIFESKMEVDLHNAPIEVKIVSSADAASHLVGPFYSLWWLENPNKPFQDLMEDNKRKALKDWTRKVVLPEIKQAFYNRHQFILENSGETPKKFLNSSH